ncbi:serine hydrolase domain-containing protein [Streptosporangium longisporum]|uniref:Serine hydrolase domain-containing protein n=1 Tax=Streptosporangium longisporum TaxID=46187 RepID=A0ABP6LC93_9ACTN
MFCDPAFTPVVEAFRQGVGPGGAALAVTAGGRLVVDVWAGTADESGTRPWRRDTVVNVFSVSKGVVATVALLCARRGLLDLDAPVARYWPEFTARATVAQLLSHRAGLPAIRSPLPPGSLYDWDAMTSALAAEEPWWTPGERHGYHAVTFGWLVGELLRRVTGREIRDLVSGVCGVSGLSGELGVPDLWIGLPRHEAHRAAFVLPPESPPAPESPSTLEGASAAGGASATEGASTSEGASTPGGPLSPAGPSGLEGSPLAEAMADPASVTAKAFLNPADQLVPGLVNTGRWRAAQIPAANGHASARALATLYGALLSGDLLDPGTLERATTVHSDGFDEVLRGRTRFGLGYMLPNEVRPFAPRAEAFGHSGSGGSLAFADPVAGIGFAYTPSRTITVPAGPDPRWPPILEALYDRL